MTYHCCSGCHCDKLRLAADTCVQCEVPDINGIYVSQVRSQSYFP